MTFFFYKMVGFIFYNQLIINLGNFQSHNTFPNFLTEIRHVYS